MLVNPVIFRNHAFTIQGAGAAQSDPHRRRTNPFGISPTALLTQ